MVTVGNRWSAKVPVLNNDNRTRSICIVDERERRKENKEGEKKRKAISSERLIVGIYVQSEKLRNRDGLSTDSWMPTKTRRTFCVQGAKKQKDGSRTSFEIK